MAPPEKCTVQKQELVQCRRNTERVLGAVKLPGADGSPGGCEGAALSAPSWGCAEQERVT